MPRCCQLLSYDLKPGSLLVVAASPAGLVMASSAVQSAFPDSRISLRMQPKVVLQYGHVAWIDSDDAGVLVRAESIAELMTQHILVETSLDSCFALGYHKVEDDEGNLVRSVLGEELYFAKYQDREDKRTALASRALGFISRHQAYQHADYLAFVPPHSGRASGLLAQITVQISGWTSKPAISVTRGSECEPQKDLDHEDRETEIAMRRRNQANSMVCSIDLVGRSIVLLDDLLETGASMDEAARALRVAGASRVLGLALTKTRKHVKYS